MSDNPSNYRSCEILFWTGVAECSICTHEWVAVVPVQVSDPVVPELECPNCKHMAGVPLEKSYE